MANSHHHIQAIFDDCLRIIASFVTMAMSSKHWSVHCSNGRMSRLWVSGTATMGIFQVVLLLRLQTHQMVGQFSNETYTIFNADILLNAGTREARKEIAPADLSIKMKPVSALPIVQIVSCEMLATCRNFQPSGPAQCTGICCYGTARGSCYRSPLLHAFNEVDCIRARESGVFP